MDLKVSDMMEYQRVLQARHPEWGGLVPERSKEQLLYSLAEMGEAVQIIKKLGTEKIVENERFRTMFTEEIGDVMMYLWDALLCLGIDAEAFSAVYDAKCRRNTGRDYVQEHVDIYGE